MKASGVSLFAASTHTSFRTPLRLMPFTQACGIQLDFSFPTYPKWRKFCNFIDSGFWLAKLTWPRREFVFWLAACCGFFAKSPALCGKFLLLRKVICIVPLTPLSYYYRHSQSSAENIHWELPESVLHISLEVMDLLLRWNIFDSYQGSKWSDPIRVFQTVSTEDLLTFHHCLSNTELSPWTDFPLGEAPYLDRILGLKLTTNLKLNSYTRSTANWKIIKIQ